MRLFEDMGKYRHQAGYGFIYRWEEKPLFWLLIMEQLFLWRYKKQIWLTIISVPPRWNKHLHWLPASFMVSYYILLFQGCIIFLLFIFPHSEKEQFLNIQIWREKKRKENLKKYLDVTLPLFSMAIWCKKKKQMESGENDRHCFRFWHARIWKLWSFPENYGVEF